MKFLIEQGFAQEKRGFQLSFAKITALTALGAALQLGVYIYLDQVLFAPTSDFKVEVQETHSASAAVNNGKTYYSQDRRFLASVGTDTIDIYSMPAKVLVRSVFLGEQRVSYFKWLEDRNLALIGFADDAAGDSGRVIVTQLNPLDDKHELCTTVNKLPQGSKITDIAFSTATNVIYMQVQTASNPDLYRIYRTDANHELLRVTTNTNRIGKVGVLPYQDCFLFDNLEKDAVVARRSNGNLEIISPKVGKYRLLGVDTNSNIIIASLNAEGMAEAVFKGGAKGEFSLHRRLPTPVEVQTLRMEEM